MLIYDAKHGMMSRTFIGFESSTLVPLEEGRVLSLVVPRRLAPELSRLYDVSARTFNGTIGGREGQSRISGAWMIDARERQAVLQVDCGDLAAPFRIRLSLLDPDWRRYLIELHEAHQLGLTTLIKLYDGESEMLSASEARDRGDDALFNSRGIQVEVVRPNVLSRVRAVAEALSSVEYLVQTQAAEAAAIHIRHTYPLLVDIHLERGGAVPALVQGLPLVLIDLGYDSDAWAESAIARLVASGLHRISDPEKPWGLADGWGFIVFPQHLSIFAPAAGIDGKGGRVVRAAIDLQLSLSVDPEAVDVSGLARLGICRFLADPASDFASARTLYSGIFHPPEEFVSACRRGLISVAVGNFGLIDKLSVVPDPAHALGEILMASVALQEVAAGTVAGFVDEGEAREALVLSEIAAKGRSREALKPPNSNSR